MILGLELMIGCFAYATKDEINVDRKEIADAQWFSADQIEKGELIQEYSLSLFMS